MRLAWIPLLPLAAYASADRYALLVGVNGYSFDKGKPTMQQLKSAPYDIGYMKALADRCGFQSSVLTEANATKAKVLKALADLAAKLKPGDQALFYFTGRGSTDSKPVDAVPSILPFDAVAKPTSDVSVSELEAWAKAVESKGAVPVVFLDCAFSTNGDKNTRENRHYEAFPKVLSRPGKARANVWSGSGIFLAATDSRGNAFEYRVDFTSDKWRSPLTDKFVGRALMQLGQGQAPTYADLLDNVQKFFARNPSYMPGTRPQPSADKLTAAYGSAIFALDGTTLPPPTPQSEAIVQQVQQGQKILKLAIDAEDDVFGPARAQTIAKYRSQFETAIKAHCPNVELLAPGVGLADRLLLVKEVGGKLQVRLYGNEVTAGEPRGKPVVGSSIDELFGQAGDEGLAARIRLESVIDQIWNWMDSAKPSQPIRLELDKTDLAVDGRFVATVAGPSAGQILLFDTDQDGVRRLIFPDKPRDVSFTGSRLFKMKVLEGTRPGKTMMKALWVDAATLPDPIALKSLDAYLAALRSKLEDPATAASVATATYRVRLP